MGSSPKNFIAMASENSGLERVQKFLYFKSLFVVDRNFASLHGTTFWWTFLMGQRLKHFCGHSTF